MFAALSTLSLQYRVHGSFYRGQKIRFFMFSTCSRSVWSSESCPLFLLSSGVSRALIIHFHTLGSFRSSCPRPSALCFSVVSVWFQLGAFPQDPQSVLGVHSLFIAFGMFG